MAAKALLTAAGFLKSTATEHATRASQSGRTSTKDNSQKARNSTATEHATSESQSGSTALRRGTALASQRGKGKRSYHDMDKDEQPPLRSYDDMDKDEQQLLEDYDTGRAKRAKQKETLKELKPFRSYDCVHG